MWFKLKCKRCGETLSGERSYDTDRTNGTTICRPWYTEKGLNHLAVACLKCGTIHDTTPALLGVLIGRPFRVHLTINPRDEYHLEGYMGKTPEAYLMVQLRNMNVPKDISVALVERKIIGIDKS